MFEVIPSPGTGNRDWEAIHRRIEIAKTESNSARTINYRYYWIVWGNALC